MTFPLAPAAINHLLSAEPWASRKLAGHAGKTAIIDAGIVVLRLKVLADGLVENAPQDALADVKIHIKPADLPLLLQNRERAFSWVRIEGDADFANTISQVSQGVRWDAEADLSRIVGDVAAARIASGARSAAGAAQATGRSIAANVAEYFLEEDPLLQRPQAVADFSAQVNQRRDDVERLAKRIERLAGSRASASGPGAPLPSAKPASAVEDGELPKGGLA
jgi:ubiquinone biosynthesis protein UbiJ